MASGDNVITILRAMPPATLAAQPAALVGGSTPAENLIVWGFDASTIWYMDFLCQLHNYASGGLTLSLVWSAASATSNNCIWSAAIRRFQDNTEDLDSAQTYDFNDASAQAAPSSANIARAVTITFTDGADMDSWADGEIAIVRIRRNASDASDTMTGNANLWSWSGTET